MAIQQMLLGIGPGGIPFNVPTWSTVDTGWTASNNNYDGDYAVASAAYAHIITGALTDGTTYRFFLDHKDGRAQYGGWVFTNTTDPTSTVPNEIQPHSMGHRTDKDEAGAYGDYASANNVSNGSDKLDDDWWSDIKGHTKKLEFVVNRTVDKVWLRLAGEDDWLNDGDPNDSTSTPSFHLPDGDTLLFGCVDYVGNGYANLSDS